MVAVCFAAYVFVPGSIAEVRADEDVACDAETERQAEELFRLGAEALAQEQFDKAISNLSQANAFCPQPALVLALAQAYKQAWDRARRDGSPEVDTLKVRAIKFYKKYIQAVHNDEGEAKAAGMNLDNVRSQIGDLEHADECHPCPPREPRSAPAPAASDSPVRSPSLAPAAVSTPPTAPAPAPASAPAPKAAPPPRPAADIEFGVLSDQPGELQGAAGLRAMLPRDAARLALYRTESKGAEKHRNATIAFLKAYAELKGEAAYSEAVVSSLAALPVSTCREARAAVVAARDVAVSLTLTTRSLEGQNPNVEVWIGDVQRSPLRPIRLSPCVDSIEVRADVLVNPVTIHLPRDGSTEYAMSILLAASVGPFVFDETHVYDKRTRLLWERSPPADGMSWETAQMHCRGLGTGYRLPTRAELLRLMPEGEIADAGQVAFSEGHGLVWTSEETEETSRGFNLGGIGYAGGGRCVIGVDPFARSVHRCMTGGGDHVMCVKSTDGIEVSDAVDLASAAPDAPRRAPSRPIRPGSVALGLGIPILVLSVAGLVAGVTELLLARSEADAIERAALSAGSWSPTLTQRVADGEAQDRLGLGLTVGGLAGTVIGIVTTSVGAARRSRSVALRPFFGPGSAGFAVGGVF